MRVPWTAMRALLVWESRRQGRTQPEPGSTRRVPTQQPRGHRNGAMISRYASATEAHRCSQAENPDSGPWMAWCRTGRETRARGRHEVLGDSADIVAQTVRNGRVRGELREVTQDAVVVIALVFQAAFRLHRSGEREGSTDCFHQTCHAECVGGGGGWHRDRKAHSRPSWCQRGPVEADRRCASPGATPRGAVTPQTSRSALTSRHASRSTRGGSRPPIADHRRSRSPHPRVPLATYMTGPETNPTSGLTISTVISTKPGATAFTVTPKFPVREPESW